jgi:hypothetical protein
MKTLILNTKINKSSDDVNSYNLLIQRAKESGFTDSEMSEQTACEACNYIKENEGLTMGVISEFTGYSIDQLKKFSQRYKYTKEISKKRSVLHRIPTGHIIVLAKIKDKKIRDKSWDSFLAKIYLNGDKVLSMPETKKMVKEYM